MLTDDAKMGITDVAHHLCEEDVDHSEHICCCFHYWPDCVEQNQIVWRLCGADCVEQKRIISEINLEEFLLSRREKRQL